MHEKQKRGKSFTTRSITLSAVSIAIAVTLSLLPLFRMPQGGSVHLCCMLLVALPGYFFGPSVGFTSAVTFSILKMIVKAPDILHPAAILFDYILGYGILGISGFFSKTKQGLYNGYGLGVLGRFVFSAFSGYIFYRQYAGDQNPWLYSIIYQISYLGPEVFITFIIISIPAVQNGLNRVKGIAEA